MDLTNTPPVLFISTKSLLTKDEQKELLALEQATGTLSTDNQGRKAELELKANRRRSISELIPIPIDGEIIPAQVVDTSVQMNKTINLVDGEMMTNPTANVVSITIATNSQGIISVLSDIMMFLADRAYSFQERSPDCAFFGEGAVVPRGFLVGIGKAGNSDTTRQMITLAIARDTMDDEQTPDELKESPVKENTSNFEGGAN